MIQNFSDSNHNTHTLALFITCSYKNVHVPVIYHDLHQQCNACLQCHSLIIEMHPEEAASRRKGRRIRKKTKYKCISTLSILMQLLWRSSGLRSSTVENTISNYRRRRGREGDKYMYTLVQGRSWCILIHMHTRTHTYTTSITSCLYSGLMISLKSWSTFLQKLLSCPDKTSMVGY